MLPSGVKTIADLVDVAQKALQGIAILVGGAFAYFRFVRGRVFKARLEMKVTTSFGENAQGEFLKVHGVIRNSGLSRIAVKGESSQLVVYGAAERRDFVDTPRWEHLASLPLADPSGPTFWIESLEVTERSWVIALTKERYFYAYRTELILIEKHQKWSSDDVVVPHLLPESGGDRIANRIV